MTICVKVTRETLLIEGTHEKQEFTWEYLDALRARLNDPKREPFGLSYEDAIASDQSFAEPALTLRDDLTTAIALLREHAARVGPMHAWWDYISRFEEHLAALKTP